MQTNHSEWTRNHSILAANHACSTYRHVRLAGNAGLSRNIAETSLIGYYGRSLTVLEDFRKSNRQYEAHQIATEAFANAIETNILPAWSDLATELEDDTRHPPAGTGSVEDWREAHRQQAADWLEVADLLKAASPTAGQAIDQID